MVPQECGKWLLEYWPSNVAWNQRLLRNLKWRRQTESNYHRDRRLLHIKWCLLRYLEETRYTHTLTSDCDWLRLVSWLWFVFSWRPAEISRTHFCCGCGEWRRQYLKKNKISKSRTLMYFFFTLGQSGDNASTLIEITFMLKYLF